MPGAGPEGQFRFLISCIRYSNNGKVDFTEVAKECNIVSKGAAAKRYERMMKAHGIHQTQTSIRDTPIPTRKRKDETSGSNRKKRKADFLDEDANDTADDDEGLGQETSKVKEEKAPTKIKKEITAIEDDSDAQYPWQHLKSKEGSPASRPDDNDIFNDYIHSSAFGSSQDQEGFGVEIAQEHKSCMGDIPNIGPENTIRESILIVD